MEHPEGFCHCIVKEGNSFAAMRNEKNYSIRDMHISAYFLATYHQTYFHEVMRYGETFCKIHKTGKPTENKEILSFTC